MTNVLVVEDDAAILRGLIDALQNEQYKVQAVSNGKKAYELACRRRFDIIILDIMLPEMTGLEICRSLRANGNDTPIVMLTGKGEEIDKVLGLELGADDYVTKPFSVRELMVRLKTVARRSTQRKETMEVVINGIRIDFNKQEVIKGKKIIEMSAKEFQLLKYLIEHQGEVISRSRILDDVWGYDVMPTTRTVDNYILSLRKKIESKPSSPKHLLTVHTAGYKFVV